MAHNFLGVLVLEPGSHTDRSHFLVSARTYSISRFIHIQTFCVYKQNVEKCSEVSMAWSIPCGSDWEGHTFVSHLKVGGQEFFNQNMREGQHFLLEKIPKFPSPPPPPRTNVPSLITLEFPANCYSKNPINYLHWYFVFSKYSTTFRLQ